MTFKSIHELKEEWANAESCDEVDTRRYCNEKLDQIFLMEGVLEYINEEFEKQRKITWDGDEEHSCNPIHQSDFIEWHKEIENKIKGEKLI